MNPFRILARSTIARREELTRQVRADFLQADRGEGLQLDRLNAVWRRCIQCVPYFRELSISHGLPTAFASLEAFSQSVPPCRKADVQRGGDRLFDAEIATSPCSWSATGGSTAQPVRFPKWGTELNVSEANEWYFRSQLGITPEDPHFRVWGHSHAFGKGLVRWRRLLERKLKDRALGITRISAYDLSEAHVLRGLRALARSRARYAYGYSRAWEHYALVLQRHSLLRKSLPRLRCLIATSESFTSDDARESVQTAFGVPVLMEYGSMETGPLAQEWRPGEYAVAWPSFYLEVEPSETGEGRLLVTSLYRRAFPLIRYDLGDVVSGFDQIRSLRRFEKVIGRSNPTLLAPDGSAIHSEPIAHVLRIANEIERFQILTEGGVVRAFLFVSADREAVEGKFGEIRERLSQVNRSLGTLPIQLVDDVNTTPAGKRPTVFAAS